MGKQNLRPGENKVTYLSDGEKISALVYLPEDYKEGEKRPAIVISRPASGVKEQTAGLYARKLSEQGFITIAFDPKGYGESEGRPQDEDPFSHISDTKHTVDYITSLPEVDADNIFNAGICMEAGIAVYTAAEDERINGTAAISPYLTAHIDYPKAYGGKTAARVMVGMLKVTNFIADNFGINFYLPLLVEKWWHKLLRPLPVQYGMREYYLKGRAGDVPNWRNKINVYSAGSIIMGEYNPFDAIKRYDKKLFFMAYADGGYSTGLLQKFYDDISAGDKELFIGRNATHFDIYYKPEFVDPITEKIAALFKKHVKRD